jgi:hypothetical protein
MKIFISWSGRRAKEIAELLNAWLPDVIQDAEPWLSGDDIDKGSMWFGDITEALAAKVGILCVTQDNKNAPWMLFEAGALSKGLPKNRVCPLLIDRPTKEVQLPLSMFNLTVPTKEDMWKLIKTINGSRDDSLLHEDRLKRSFEQMVA